MTIIWINNTIHSTNLDNKNKEAQKSQIQNPEDKIIDFPKVDDTIKLNEISYL